jgi:hypothetical protein
MGTSVRYFILLSFIGGLFVVIMGGVGGLNPEPVDGWGKLLVGVPFILSCLLGIVLSFRPGLLRGFGGRKGSGVDEQRGEVTVRGHHPDCGKFERHAMLIGERAVCTGCLGLALGSIAAMVMMLIYLVGSWEASYPALVIIMITGLSLVVLGLLETAFTAGQTVHMLMNSLLVIGFFLVVVSVYQSTGSPLYGMVAIVISFLWLETRIQISNWRHVEICDECPERCKAFLAS